MSYIRIPTKSDGKLPSIPSIAEDETPVPIVVTPWKCRRQVLGSLIVCLGIFAVGNVFGWAAVALRPLQEEKRIYPGALNEAAVASLFVFGALFSGPPAGYAMLKLGRKMATFWFALLFSLAWSFIPAAYFVQDNTFASMTLLLIGRFATGFAGAGCLIIGPVYVREMCDEGVRTMMGSLVPLVLVGGNGFCFALGNFIPWWVLSILCNLFPVALCFLIFFLPNTPRHLLSMKREKEAHQAMCWLAHGFTLEEQERIFKRIKRGVEYLNDSTTHAMKQADRRKQENRLQLRLTSRPVLRPLLTSIFLIMFQQGSGTNVVSTFTQDILEKGSSFISTEAGTVVVGVNFVIFVFIATLVVDRLGRRPLLLVGTICQFLVLLLLGLYFYYHHKWEIERDLKALHWITLNFSWLPIVSCTLFIACYAMGLGSITWILSTEINHPDFQEIAGALDSLTYWSTAFTSIVTLPSLREAIQYHWCFWMYSVVSFGAFWFCYFFIYETKGKTQEEIMAHYKGHGYDPDLKEDDEADSKSIGSLGTNGAGGQSQRKRGGRGSGGGDRKFSTGSDWSTEMATIYEAENED